MPLFSKRHVFLFSCIFEKAVLPLEMLQTLSGDTIPLRLEYLRGVKPENRGLTSYAVLDPETRTATWQSYATFFKAMQVEEDETDHHTFQVKSNEEVDLTLILTTSTRVLVRTKLDLAEWVRRQSGLKFNANQPSGGGTTSFLRHVITCEGGVDGRVVIVMRIAVHDGDLVPSPIAQLRVLCQYASSEIEDADPSSRTRIHAVKTFASTLMDSGVLDRQQVNACEAAALQAAADQYQALLLAVPGGTSSSSSQSAVVGGVLSTIADSLSVAFQGDAVVSSFATSVAQGVMAIASAVAPALPFAESLLGLCQTLYTMYQSYQSILPACEDLKRRVAMIVDVVRAIESHDPEGGQNATSVREALTFMKKVLIQATKFVSGMINANPVIRFFASLSAADEFTSHIESLHRALGDLHAVWHVMTSLPPDTINNNNNNSNVQLLNWAAVAAEMREIVGREMSRSLSSHTTAAADSAMSIQAQLANELSRLQVDSLPLLFEKMEHLRASITIGSELGLDKDALGAAVKSVNEHLDRAMENQSTTLSETMKAMQQTLKQELQQLVSHMPLPPTASSSSSFSTAVTLRDDVMAMLRSDHSNLRNMTVALKDIAEERLTKIESSLNELTNDVSGIRQTTGLIGLPARQLKRLQPVLQLLVQCKELHRADVPQSTVKDTALSAIVKTTQDLVSSIRLYFRGVQAQQITQDIPFEFIEGASKALTGMVKYLTMLQDSSTCDDAMTKTVALDFVATASRALEELREVVRGVQLLDDVLREEMSVLHSNSPLTPVATESHAASKGFPWSIIPYLVFRTGERIAPPHDNSEAATATHFEVYPAKYEHRRVMVKVYAASSVESAGNVVREATLRFRMHHRVLAPFAGASIASGGTSADGMSDCLLVTDLCNVCPIRSAGTSSPLFRHAADRLIFSVWLTDFVNYCHTFSPRPVVIGSSLHVDNVLLTRDHRLPMLTSLRTAEEVAEDESPTKRQEDILRLGHILLAVWNLTPETFNADPAGFVPDHVLRVMVGCLEVDAARRLTVAQALQALKTMTPPRDAMLWDLASTELLRPVSRKSRIVFTNLESRLVVPGTFAVEHEEFPEVETLDLSLLAAAGDVQMIDHHFASGNNDYQVFPGITEITWNATWKTHSLKIGKCFCRQLRSLRVVDLTGLLHLRVLDERFLEECVNLERVVLPQNCKSLRHIGSRFLAKCTSLREMDMSSTVTSLSHLGGSAWENCTSLVSLRVMTVTNPLALALAHFFLKGCTALETIDLTGFTAITTLGDSFMENCETIEDVDLSALVQLEVIGNNFLRECKNVRSVRLPVASSGGAAVIQKVGTHFMYNCRMLQTLDVTPLRRLTELPNQFMKDCKSLRLLTVADDLPIFSNVTTLKDDVFAFCHSDLRVDLRSCELRRCGRGCNRNALQVAPQYNELLS